MSPSAKKPGEPDHSALDHPRRQALFDAIQAEPGCTRSQLEARLDYSRGVSEHHLSALEDADLIQRLPDVDEHEQLCFTYEDIHLWEDEATRLLYGSPSTRNVALFIVAWPGVARRELEERLGVDLSTVLYHIRRLEEYGLVVRGRCGRRMDYFALKPLRDWVRRVGHVYERPWDVLPGDADPFNAILERG